MVVRWLKLAWFVTCVSVVVGVPRLAWAEPFVGEARVAVGASGDDDPAQARARAVLEARTAALEAAIDHLALERASTTGDLLARPQPWTAAYRVLEQRVDANELVIRLEVDIDVARLHKRLMPPPARSGSGYRLGTLDSDDRCPGVKRERIVEPLRAVGVVVDDGSRPPLSLELHCQPLGKVAFTYLHAASVTVVARGPQGVLTRAAETAFADSGEDAVAAALFGVLSDVASRLSASTHARLELVVEQPWPAANLRKVIAAVDSAVLGVRSVALARVEQSGAVHLEIDGDLDAKALARRLATLEFQGFELVNPTVESSHAVHVRLQ